MHDSYRPVVLPRFVSIALISQDAQAQPVKKSMYIVAIGWLYVALMMSVAEATHINGTVMGAIVTFVLYGLLPIALVMYLLGTPARKRAIKAREAAEHAAWQARQGTTTLPSDPPDAGRDAAGDALAPVRKEP